MCKEKTLCISLLIALMGIAILINPGTEPSRVQAQSSTLLTDHGTCIKCHEDLYFLHDTGNWFCIRESPMRCVDCHGGNPSAFKKEDAHANRKAHPIINEDVSKCQECHPAECAERVAKFDRIASISEVLVAVPYQPTPVLSLEQPLEATATEPDKYPGWISAMEIIVLTLITGLALTVYFVHKKHHT
jgi:hypothetical protein